MRGVSLRWPMRLLLTLGERSLPLWQWWLGRRLHKGKENTLSVSQKLMTHLDRLDRPLRRDASLIWGHAVSVGEVLAMLGLFRRLSSQYPQVQFLLTSSTITSGQALAKQLIPEQIQHQYAPLDHPALVRRFLAYWRPSLACWLQSDLWPHTVLETRATGIPMLMFNARMSKTKILRRKRFSWFYEPLLASYSEIFAQNTAYRDNLTLLGDQIPISRLVGNVKALAPSLPVPQTALKDWASVINQRPVWILASSHDGEEAMALQAQVQVCEQQPDALLVIVPRHIGDASKTLYLSKLMGLNAVMRSEHLQPLPTTSVYIANTMGEMGLWYAVAHVALVGGSLVPHGGHNPYEASAAGCPVLHGPYVANCQESYDDLNAKGLARMVRNVDELTQCVLDHLNSRLATRVEDKQLVHQVMGDPLYERICSYVQVLVPARP
jgi:3-deoxy-D-manno-octulosonic-acid transferase